MNQKWCKSKVIWIETVRVNARTTIISCPFPFKSIKKKPWRIRSPKSSGCRHPQALPISFVSLIKLILAGDYFFKKRWHLEPTKGEGSLTGWLSDFSWRPNRVNENYLRLQKSTEGQTLMGHFIEVPKSESANKRSCKNGIFQAV